MKLIKALQLTIRELDPSAIDQERQTVIQPLIEYLQDKINSSNAIKLNFICTHNSRRSLLAQIWAQTAAFYYGFNAKCYSGGVEVTEFNPRAIEAIKKAGFRVSVKGDKNPTYFIFYSDDEEPIYAFSKLYNDAINPTKNYAAVMTCSHADETCPFIQGADERISLLYEDPKLFDGTPIEASKYKERSNQIANEMFYIFSKINKPK